MEAVGDVFKQLILPGLASALLVALFGMAREQARKIKDERLRELALRVVKAIEQVYGPSKGDAIANEKKKAKALEKLPEADTDLLEAAVFDMKKGQAN